MLVVYLMWCFAKKAATNNYYVAFEFLPNVLTFSRFHKGRPQETFDNLQKQRAKVVFVAVS